MSKITKIVRRWAKNTHTHFTAKRRAKSIGQASFPLKGFSKGHLETRHVDDLNDEDLAALNSLLPWKCFTVDSSGRRFGNRAWPGKRETPQIIPDRRIVAMAESFNLADKHVLEIGCFEGIHTTALCMYAARVTAVDSRIENVVKTIVRTAMFGYAPTVFVCNVEDERDLARLPLVDIVYHVGVLYHLKDPVSHLHALARIARTGIMLDTQFARPASVDRTYVVADRAFRYRHYDEGGKAEVFSGMYDHAKWLLLDDIRALLAETGFPAIEIVEERDEPIGPRVLLCARRSAHPV